MAFFPIACFMRFFIVMVLDDANTDPRHSAEVRRPGSSNRGVRFAAACNMVEEQGSERRGAQQETPLEREARKNPSNSQDVERPAEGRDEAPAEPVDQGKRSSKSPWLGGG